MKGGVIALPKRKQESFGLNVTPDKNKTCPDCGKEIKGFTQTYAICPGCGRSYHEDCYLKGRTEVPSNVVLLIFPKLRVALIYGAKQYLRFSPGGHVDGTMDQREAFISRLSDRELLERSKEVVCHNCHARMKELAFRGAADLERAGRYEEAAAMFDYFELTAEAGHMRKKDKVQVVKNISIDLNQLLDRLKTGGLVSVYKCPNCSASIKISGTTSVQKLSKCEYCGTVLQTDDLVKFIQDILS
jgi:DNA-directed RNA polymerase subunit RPC12/RpoP